MLWDVQAADPLVFLGAPVLLTAVALFVGVYQRLAEELAFRRVDERVRPECRRQIRQRAACSEKNTACGHLVSALCEPAYERGHGVGRQPPGTAPAGVDMGLRFRKIQ